jgi:hypothetical protein
MMDYTEDNLKLVSDSIRRNLTIDLLPKKMIDRNQNGGTNGTYGHCHTASGVLYKIFGPKNLHMYRALDGEGLYHWWVMDRGGRIIDLTSEQYTLLGRTPPYDKGEKSGMLGFDYKKRVCVLLERVLKDLDL